MYTRSVRWAIGIGIAACLLPAVAIAAEEVDVVLVELSDETDLVVQFGKTLIPVHVTKARGVLGDEELVVQVKDATRVLNSGDVLRIEVESKQAPGPWEATLVVRGEQVVAVLLQDYPRIVPEMIEASDEEQVQPREDEVKPRRVARIRVSKRGAEKIHESRDHHQPAKPTGIVEGSKGGRWPPIYVQYSGYHGSTLFQGAGGGAGVPGGAGFGGGAPSSGFGAGSGRGASGR